MQFVMICEDKPDSLALRMANRDDHLEFIDTHSEKIRLAGPMLSDDGEGMVGSLLIIDAESIDQVKEISANDPYAQAGLFAKVTIRPFRQVVPAQ
jgi:uncharacterized protein YciI